MGNTKQPISILYRKIASACCEGSLFFSCGSNKHLLHTIHVFVGKGSPTRFHHKSRLPTRSNETRTTSFILFTDALIQLPVFDLTPDLIQTLPISVPTKALLLNPVLPPRESRIRGETYAVRDQRKVRWNHCKIESPLGPFMQAGTLSSASPFPATASGITPAG